MKYVRKHRWHDGKLDGPVLEVITIEDHEPVDVFVESNAIAHLSDGSWEFVWNLTVYRKPKWAVDQTCRRDKGDLVEDLCEHGVGHPNKDWMDLHDPDGELGFGIHGCDGCCCKKDK